MEKSEKNNCTYEYVGNGQYIKFSTFKRQEIQTNYFTNNDEVEMLEEIEIEPIIIQKKKKIDEETLKKLKTAGKIIAASVAAGAIIYSGAKVAKIQDEDMKKGIEDYKKYAQEMTENNKEISYDTYVWYNKLKNEAEIKGK